jgi:transposase InsO family protein
MSPTSYLSAATSLTKLSGSNNYATWALQVRLLLEEAELWQAVESKPGSNENWTTQDRSAFRIILLTLANDVVTYVLGAKTARDVWETLRRVYAGGGIASQLQLLRKLQTMQLEDKSVTVHIGEMRELARRIRELGGELSDMQLVCSIFNSLPSRMEPAVLALESSVKFDTLSIDAVTEQLVSFDLRRGHRAQGESALAAKQVATKQSDKARPRMIRRCYLCNDTGHMARECPLAEEFRKARKAPTNTANVANNANSDDDYLLTSSTLVANPGTWVIDSGASRHQCADRQAFSVFKEHSSTTTIGNGTKLDVRGIGKVVVKFSDDKDVPHDVTLQNVLFVPDMAANLISVSALFDAGASVIFSATQCTIKGKSGKIITSAQRRGNMYVVEPGEHVAAISTAAVPGSDTWHARFGHVSHKAIELMAQQQMVDGLPIRATKAAISPCSGCARGKLSRDKFPKLSLRRASKPLELVHADLAGPMSVPSWGGARYWVVLIDDATRMIWTEAIAEKSDAVEAYKRFEARATNESGQRIIALRTDNGGEFCSGAFEEHLAKQGTRHELSTPRTPSQNGVAERANRTVGEMVRCMIFHHNVDKRFWAEALAYATTVRNMCPTTAVKDQTPVEAWSHRKPNVTRLRVFGCRALVHVPDERRSKLDAKAQECMFIGVAANAKCWRFWNAATKRTVLSRDAAFFEEEPGTRTGSNQVEGQLEVTQSDEGHSSDNDEEAADHDNEGECDVDAHDEGERNADSNNEDAQPELELRKSTRRRQPPPDWREQPGSQHESSACLSIDGEPETVYEARKLGNHEQWEQAMLEELAAVERNGTWELVDLPQGRKAIGCRWVFKQKRNAAGEVVRHKARIVARGFLQQPGVDFEETFAPVAKLTTIRILFAMVATHGFEVHQVDIVTAYLNGIMREEVYMRQPPGFDDGSGRVCRLKKALYGLKQAGRAWYEHIDGTLRKMGFKRSSYDHSLYMHVSFMHTYLALYVDDCVIVSSTVSIVTKIKDGLAKEYEVKDLGEISFILGIRVQRDRKHRKISMSQDAYISAMLERYGLANGRPASTPVDPNSSFRQAPEDYTCETGTQRLYQQIVGSLMYVMLCTRPDIAFAVGSLARHAANPTAEHMTGAKRVLRYLRGSRDFALTYDGSENRDFVGYSDADWAGDTDTRRSTTGLTVIMAGCAVSWASRLQRTVALSTTEAEYMALAEVAREITWIRALVKDVGYKVDAPTRVNCDNQGTIALVKNPVHHKRTKHIDIRYHFTREKHEAEEISVEYCSTQDMLADILTKGLAKPKFEEIREKLGLFR